MKYLRFSSKLISFSINAVPVLQQLAPVRNMLEILPIPTIPSPTSEKYQRTFTDIDERQLTDEDNLTAWWGVKDDFAGGNILSDVGYVLWNRHHRRNSSRGRQLNRC